MSSDKCSQYQQDYEKLLALKQEFDAALENGEANRDFGEVKRFKDELEKLISKISGELKDFKRNVEIEEEIRGGNFSRTDELAHLSLEVAAVLSKHEGHLWLNGLTAITLEVASALAKHNYGIGLNGLIAITPEVASALAKHEGHLGLNGLIAITPEVASALAKHEGHLGLSGLTAITPEIAAALVKHKGDLWLRDNIKKQVDRFRNN